MSYDISLRDPVTNETLELPSEHLMIGGTYVAKYDEINNTFIPKPITDAWLNVTYNYSSYYYDASENDSRFERNGKNCGIEGLIDKTGYESISMLESMIQRIKDKYYVNGDWITTKRNKTRYLDKNGKVVDDYFMLGEILNGNLSKYTKEEYVDDIDEGAVHNYWDATAANAIKPLYQLITMAKLRPDGIWKVE